MGLINKTSSFFALLRLFSLCSTMMMNLPCLMASCANFLRTIYHTLSASQAPRRGHAPRIIPMPATALVFCLIVTDLHSTVLVLICSVDATPPQPPVGLLWVQSVLDSIIYRFLFQNPVQPPILSISCSTEFWSMFPVLCFLSLIHIWRCRRRG